jgi:segregation and condensation protein A
MAGISPAGTVDGRTLVRQPIVLFGDGRRPESATLVRVADFDGPLGLLLALIEGQKLDVLTVPLGALAGAYLEALARLEGDRLANVSAFVAIAGQLILIKSRALLPRHQPDSPELDPDADVPDPEAELRARLLLYRAFRDAGAGLQELATARIGLFRREPGTATATALAGAQPTDAPPLDPASLVEMLEELAQIAPPPALPPEIMPRTVTIGERAAIIRAALRDANAIVLQELLAGIGDRVVLAVTFLAMLELVKRREIVVEQGRPWGPIVVRAATTSERSAGGLTDRARHGPLDESLESFA